MRFLVLLQLVAVAAMAFAGEKQATCTLSEKSIVSRSPTGVPQVSNLGLIAITCGVLDTRPFPSKPGDVRLPLRIEAPTYEIEEDGSTRLVASKAEPSGGSNRDGTEEVFFSLEIPLEFAERDAEARRLHAILGPDLHFSDEEGQKAIENGREAMAVLQHRVGHFRVECHMMDAGKVVGVGIVELEVLFKGRFSDQFVEK